MKEDIRIEIITKMLLQSGDIPTNLTIRLLLPKTTIRVVRKLDQVLLARSPRLRLDSLQCLGLVDKQTLIPIIVHLTWEVGVVSIIQIEEEEVTKPVQ